ncbi:hypothetical protein Val02_14630 [Virgisporangium aliadipatigenens]|uniref:Uncharacterized protein n=1 Tax=Virgisporangium aliadipatigenens TaxID=741659 RepID=A0A8J4DPM1_9ACTN|nr:hypothetical protein [Virgisporangium aliadipatigenens]GIJ44577.1 hypothetical protein Val02_14630 [Virgisporangium aliadipatigenens]
MTWPLRAELDGDNTRLVDRLCTVALEGLPRMYRPDSDEFAFTRARSTSGELELRGTSTRYAAIVALGAQWLPEEKQRAVLGGMNVEEFVALLVSRLDRTTNLGDAGLIAWAAAQSAHPLLPKALERLRELDDPNKPQYVVEASWVVAALASSIGQAEVKDHLAAARERLLVSRHGNSPLFPHGTGPGLLPWYRSHVACYADQVYPIQALAILHRMRGDEEAKTAAVRAADRICELQGPGGQWWWHYDARTGGLVEGYPVYTVHQASMGPMALLDLTDAGGPSYREAIERGLRWITDPAEHRGHETEPIVHDADGVTWRKIYRGDPKKVVRAVQGLTTKAVPGLHMPGIDAAYKPFALDRECRPYEFGWLLYAWLAR